MRTQVLLLIYYNINIWVGLKRNLCKAAFSFFLLRLEEVHTAKGVQVPHCCTGLFSWFVFVCFCFFVVFLFTPFLSF